MTLLDQETRNYVGRKLLELTLMELFVFRFMQVHFHYNTNPVGTISSLLLLYKIHGYNFHFVPTCVPLSDIIIPFSIKKVAQGVVREVPVGHLRARRFTYYSLVYDFFLSCTLLDKYDHTMLCETRELREYPAEQGARTSCIGSH